MGIIQWITRFPVRIAASKLVSGYENESNDWDRIEVSFSPKLMGYKCLKEIKGYYEGESKVYTETIEEIKDWLDGCNYKTRTNADGFSDEWLHPLDFEKFREGHCVDFAIWCWRKLYEIGIQADLMLGERIRDGKYWQHGWVIFLKEGKEYLFDPLPISGHEVIEELTVMRSKYIPWLSISKDTQCFLFSGYVSAINRGVK